MHKKKKRREEKKKQKVEEEEQKKKRDRMREKTTYNPTKMFTTRRAFKVVASALFLDEITTQGTYLGFAMGLYIFLDIKQRCSGRA